MKKSSEIVILSRPVHVVRMDRKTLSVEVAQDGTILVKAPVWSSSEDIRKFVGRHEEWIASRLEQLNIRKEKYAHLEKLTDDDIRSLAQQALEYIPKRVAYYAPIVGVTYGRITIRNQRSRWGSCTAQGNLNFNCLLMLAPPEVIDSVVVHELCHRLQMNHSKAFYREVYRVYPEYDYWHGWLKEHGDELMYRMTG